MTLTGGAVEARLDQLQKSSESVVLKCAGGGTVSGRVQHVSPEEVSLSDAQGAIFAIERKKIDPAEFIPDRGAPAAELAYRGLALDPAKALGLVLDFENSDETVFLWIPFLVRLAKLEIVEKAGRTAREARELLSRGEIAQGSTPCLIDRVDFEASVQAMALAKPRILPDYGFLQPEFARAEREAAALELLFARRYSQVLASYRETTSAPAAGELLLQAFEAALKEGSEELLAGSGWFDNRWEVWPRESLLQDRQRIFDTGNPHSIVFRDPTGPRNLIMNDSSTRAPEGILIRFAFKPEPGRGAEAYWSFLLRGGKGGTQSYLLRSQGTEIALYRPVLESGTADTCLVHAPLSDSGDAGAVRTLALVPGEGVLHVFLERKPVLSLPEDQARIPHQLNFTVCRGAAAIECMLARKPLSAPRDSDKK